MKTFALLGLVALLVGGVGCAKKAKKPVVQTAPTQPAETASAEEPPPANTGTGFASGGNTNYVAGGGVATNVRQAARRTVALSDMQQLGQAITNVEIVEGMPDVNRIKAEVRTFGPIAKSIEDGTIILTGTRDRAGLWAYEVDADKRGGIVLVGGTPRRADAAEVQQLLGRK